MSGARRFFWCVLRLGFAYPKKYKLEKERNTMNKVEDFINTTKLNDLLNKKEELINMTKLNELLNKKEAEEKTAAVRKYLLDEKTGLFVSGEEKQINYASQVWLILAGAVSIEEGSAMLDKLDELKPEKGMVSPYMNHHYVEALLMCGKKDQAMDYMKYYWGGMINHGADTFWELYNPENPAESPYGSSIVNSYCHAWSCTPTYLLRKYFN